MFRWPLALTPLSLGSLGATRDALLEITPRGAVFTLAALAHAGHPSHMAVIDAYLKGQMRLSGGAGIGEDSRLVASALAAPLVAAHELGIERLSLSNLILLPLSAPERGLGGEVSLLRRGEVEQGRERDDGLTRAPESPRFLLRAPASPDRWLWVRAAERFEVAGCTGTPNPGLGSRWYDVVIQLPERPTSNSGGRLPGGQRAGALPPVDAELRQPTEAIVPTPGLVDALRTLGLMRFGRAGSRLRQVPEVAIKCLMSGADQHAPLAFQDVSVDRRALPLPPELPITADATALAAALGGPIAQRQPVETLLHFQGEPLGVSLTPDLDGYQTLCLLPPPGIAPAALFEVMRAAAWEVIEALIGRPLAEHRTEPIALRLIGADGHTTTLDIGASVVVVRNQIVFTAWVGTDGRVMLKLFPPGGMPIP